MTTMQKMTISAATMAMVMKTSHFKIFEFIPEIIFRVKKRRDSFVRAQLMPKRHSNAIVSFSPRTSWSNGTS